MLLSLVLAIERSKLTEVDFFRCAHQWAFGKDCASTTDYEQFKLHGIIPKYVIQYLKEMGA